ncbi:LysR family transcriptional regulator [Streptomyces sp. NBC_01014]|uniref:helix-turn-helix domain-containing protein n=1 Tax=Streptomyces sp. NBC_01014 TaxID=2903719 RepID=UPI003863AC9D
MEPGDFSGAARPLLMSRPAVSHHIRKLERSTVVLSGSARRRAAHRRATREKRDRPPLRNTRRSALALSGMLLSA